MAIPGKITTNYIKGLTYRDIMSMSEKELKEVIRYGAIVANARIRRLNEAGIQSPAVESVKERRASIVRSDYEKYRFSAKQDNIYRLRGELQALVRFLNAKTSTVKGAKKHIKETSDRLGIDYDSMSESEREDFWKVYNRIVNDDALHAKATSIWGDSQQVMYHIAQMYDKGLSYRDIVEAIEREYEKQYEVDEDEWDEFFE